MSKTVLRIM